ATETITAFLNGAQATGSDPLNTDAALATRPSPSPFSGNPEDITVRSADLGSGWTFSDQRRDPPDLYTTGKLVTTYRGPGGETVQVSATVFRTREDVLVAWLDASRGGSLETCEASFYQGGASVNGACLVQNVVIQMRGASYDMTRTA